MIISLYPPNLNYQIITLLECLKHNQHNPSHRCCYSDHPKRMFSKLFAVYKDCNTLFQTPANSSKTFRICYRKWGSSKISYIVYVWQYLPDIVYILLVSLKRSLKLECDHAFMTVMTLKNHKKSEGTAHTPETSMAKNPLLEYLKKNYMLHCTALGNAVFFIEAI